MKKADLEAARERYYALVSDARAAYQNDAFTEAMEFAVASWEYVDAMMQYERKYEDKEFHSILGIDIVLQVAPLHFDTTTLDKLDLLLKSQRRIDKNTTKDLADAVAKARALMWDAHKLWGHLERNSDARQDQLRQELGGDQDSWRWISEKWEKMGLLHRKPDHASYRLQLVTRMDERVSGKCFACGAVGKAPKSRFLADVKCPKCGTTGNFVIATHSLSNQENEGPS